MNCGLGNLADLKSNLLAGSQQTSTIFDAVIRDIGLGVAGRFDKYCNRSFAYAENFTEIFMGNRAFWYVQRYPFVAVAKVELKYFATDSWTDITAQPLIANPETGQLNFGYTLGPAPLQVRITYTGGYWFQKLEPTEMGYIALLDQGDAGYPAALPTAIQNSPNLTPPGIEPYKFILPAEIRLAWLLQCQLIWSLRDKLGLAVIDKPGKQSGLNELRLSPEVREVLDNHRRYETM